MKKTAYHKHNTYTIKMASTSCTSVSNTSNDSQMRTLVRQYMFDVGTLQMDEYSCRNHYHVYEYTDIGIVNTHSFLSRNAAYDFVNEFCDPASKVYVFKTKCIREFDPQMGHTCEQFSDEEEDDVTYVPPSDDEDVPEEYDSEHGEEFDDSETPSLEGMFFRTYGKGYLLTPPADSEYFGVKYFLDGWWMPKFNSWFFKHDHWEQLEELGATFVSKRSNKSKSCSARSGSGSAGSKRSGVARSIRFDHDFSGMSFTKYGKGFILTCDENDRRYGTAYLVDNSNRSGSSVIDGGFWNSSANGWFFKKTHFDFLVESGAQFIKSEDDFVTSDTQIIVRPKFTRYGKGWLLMSDENFPYDSSRKYFENGWYMPAKKAWFFKTADKNAFIKKFS